MLVVFFHAAYASEDMWASYFHPQANFEWDRFQVEGIKRT